MGWTQRDEPIDLIKQWRTDLHFPSSCIRWTVSRATVGERMSIVRVRMEKMCEQTDLAVLRIVLVRVPSYVGRLIGSRAIDSVAVGDIIYFGTPLADNRSFLAARGSVGNGGSRDERRKKSERGEVESGKLHVYRWIPSEGTWRTLWLLSRWST